MTDIMNDGHRAGFFGRLGRFLIAISEAAVAIHYHAPWQKDEPIARTAPRQSGDCCAA